MRQFPSFVKRCIPATSVPFVYRRGMTLAKMLFSQWGCRQLRKRRFQYQVVNFTFQLNPALILSILRHAQNSRSRPEGVANQRMSIPVLARRAFRFASGLAWGSLFCDLRHLTRENVNFGAGPRGRKPSFFIAPREPRRCKCHKSTGDSAET